MKNASLLLLIVSVSSSTLAAQDLSPEEKEAGFISLFNGKDLTDWKFMGKGESNFSVKDGAIHYKGGGSWLCYTPKEFPDFELRIDFQLIKKGGDGGIFFRAGGGTRYELQVKDYPEQGRLFGMPYNLDKDKVAKARKPQGEWEGYRLVVQGPKVEVYLNGVLVNTSNGATRRTPGFIGLQSEGGEQAFRNIRVRPLPEK